MVHKRNWNDACPQCFDEGYYIGQHVQQVFRVTVTRNPGRMCLHSRVVERLHGRNDSGRPPISLAEVAQVYGVKQCWSPSCSCRSVWVFRPLPVASFRYPLSFPVGLWSPFNRTVTEHHLKYLSVRKLFGPTISFRNGAAIGRCNGGHHPRVGCSEDSPVTIQ